MCNYMEHAAYFDMPAPPSLQLQLLSLAPSAAALGHAQLKHFTAAATAIAIEIECGLPIAA